MKKIKILTILGTRPQFIKAAVVSPVLRRGFNEVILHTGQHYDAEMSAELFKELKLPVADYNLGVGSHSQAKQVALMLTKIERKLLKEKPNMVLVYGDTNSTLAGALAASKLKVPIAHIEAGLRSFCKTMPEEINRIVADRLSDLLFSPTANAVKNLKNEGIVKGVYNVGDVMYEGVLNYLESAKRRSRILSELDIAGEPYLLTTIHRAENTDSHKRLKDIINIFSQLQERIIFPVHPRTQKALGRLMSVKKSPNLMLIRPVSYFDMLILEANAKAILTDSGGVQKEAYFLNKPCLILREVTEWTETIAGGGNRVVGTDKNRILKAINKLTDERLENNHKYFGDGRSSEKIFAILQKNKSIFL